MTTSIPLRICERRRAAIQHVFNFCYNGQARYALLRCPKFVHLAFARRISTAAIAYGSLYLPQAALANAPTSIPLRICERRRAAIQRLSIIVYILRFVNCKFKKFSKKAVLSLLRQHRFELYRLFQKICFV